MKDILYGYEIEESVKNNNIHHFFPFDCSICGEKYGYYFNNGVVTFDGACGCGAVFGERISNYQEIADLYNNNIENEEFRQMFLDYFKLGDIIE